MTKGNAALMKNINLNKLRQVLKEIRSATKPQLAAMTGLSVVTINSLIRILVNRGEVLETEILLSNGGRPAASFQYNGTYQLALLIYMVEKSGKDTACVRIVNLFHEVIDQIDLVMEDIVLTSFDPLIEKMLSIYPAVKVIGFGLPGVEVDGKLFLCDYKHLKEQKFSTYIRTRYGLPVIIENDINTAVAGYCYSRKITDTACIIGIYFPDKYPPGAGIFLRGQIYKGCNGFAGEVKYLPFSINWDHFDYHDGCSMQDMMLKTIRSFHCMYNPNEMILYGTAVTEELINAIKESCVTDIEKMMMPRITRSDELIRHFEIGLCELTLSLLEPIIN